MIFYAHPKPYFFLLAGQVNLPEPTTLIGEQSQEPLPYMLVGDEAFPSRPYLMRPIPGRSMTNDAQRIYNYRLSRARRVIENAFGKYCIGMYSVQ